MKRTMGISLMAIVILSVAAVQTKKKKPDSDQSTAQKPPAAVSVNPASLDFGNQVVGRASKSKRITLTNTGGKKLYVNSVAVDGDNSEDFTLVHDTCTGATIASGKSCVLDVSFTPAQLGTRKGGLTVTDDAIDSPQKMGLAGSGINSIDVPPTSRPPQ